jgi:hypothetical protein
MQNISTNIKKKQITLKTAIPTQCWYLYQSIEIAHNVKSSLAMKIVIEVSSKVWMNIISIPENEINCLFSF